MDVIIAIGFDGADLPGEFEAQVESVVHRLGEMNASIVGETHSAGWGREEGRWYAVTFPSFMAYVEARSRILAIGAAHNQDAIAFTYGRTDVASCPPRSDRACRDEHTDAGRGEVVDLMEALERSLERERELRGGARD